jgi:formylglycine-generating enzyme required for sulfatase activity
VADEPTLPQLPGQPMPGVPTKIGRFEIRRQLGEGSFGAVYLAYDPDLDREVALKIPGGMTPASRAEFLKEARAAAKIMHPNVCQVFEVSKTDDNPPFIVSRFVGGGTLADYIRKANGNLPVADALKIAGKIASGLAAAHAKGIVHRDLKPGNILYDDEHDDFLITDFGLAKVLDDGSQSSRDGIGTPLYMSPEQCDPSRGKIDRTADVYAVGVILYELLTGERPFSGNKFALMYAHLNTQPKPPSENRSDLGTRYDALCLKAMAKVASERYLSAKEFGDAIRNALRPVVPPTLPATLVAPKPALERKAGDRIELTLPGGEKMPFAYCPPGAFLMGSPASEKDRRDDELQHIVVISKGFYVGVSPVTQAQWQAVMKNNPSHFKGETRPVEQVSWDDAQAYCQALNALQSAGAAVRLPTEAEWEYACRGGTTTPFYFGSQLKGTQANCDGNHPYGRSAKGPSLKETTPVGAYVAKFPHPWGLCDVHGNVWEWCSDLYDSDYYKLSPTTDPRCDDGKQKYRVLRGGSWYNGGLNCRAARRDWYEPATRNNLNGFRLLLPIHSTT